MKKTIMAIVFVVAATTISFAQTSKNQTPKGHQHKAVKTMYTCTMHPEIISDTPGHCPKCGMILVKMKDTMMNMNHDSVPLAKDSMMKH